MNELKTEQIRRIFYHTEIINPEHRSNCNTCDMAYFLIKDILKVSEVEKN